MSADDRHSRAVLPMRSDRSAGRMTYDAKDPSSSFPPIRPIRPPAGAPNVIIALIDEHPPSTLPRA